MVFVRRLRASIGRHVAPLTAIELGGTLVCTSCFTFWVLCSGRYWSISLPFFFAALCFASVITGRFFLDALRILPRETSCFPASFLVGYFLVNSTLYLLAWTSPFRISTNFLVLLAAIVLAGLVPIQLRRVGSSPSSEEWADWVGLLVSMAAAMLWSQESLRSVIEVGRVVLCRPWIDGFYHASQIWVQPVWLQLSRDRKPLK